MRLREVPPEVYAREVLPLTASLWAAGRSFEQYVAQTLEIARGRYGRRHYRTIGLYDGKLCVASFKRYERTVHLGTRRLPAIGFGAVFTPPQYRGRGYASVMLAAALDLARREGYEIAYLFSDIRPQFYAEIGFRTLSSRKFSLNAAELPSTRLHLATLAAGDWAAVGRLYDLCERRRRAGFLRSAAVWDWVRTRARHASEHPSANTTNLVARRGSAVAAYVLGTRVPRRDAYFVEEFAFADERSATLIAPLLRAAAGDLRRIADWLPPGGASAILPKARIRKRARAITMIAPLGAQGRSLFEAVAGSRDDFCWATDHV